MSTATGSGGEAPHLQRYGSPPGRPSPLVAPTSSPSVLAPTQSPPGASPSITESRQRSLTRPDLVSRNSGQSSRVSVASAVQSIPEHAPVHGPVAQPKARRGSILGGSTRVNGTGLASGAGAKVRTAGSTKAMIREGYEMGPMGSDHKAAGGVKGGTVFSAITTGSTKEDLAMAKWRKWAVDQPNSASNLSAPSPTASRKPSTSGPSPYAMQSPGSSSSSPPPHQYTLSPSSIPSSSYSPRYLPDAPTYPEVAPSRSQSASSSGGQPDQRAFVSSEIYMTDTVRALQDVELAVDEDAFTRTTATARQSSRLLSKQSRLSEADNPFMDIAGRLTSRRIRPIVLELVQALGHYIFTLWTLHHPDLPCPWILPKGEAAPGPQSGAWASRTITAVVAGYADGHVLHPSQSALAYWRSEVEYGLRDVTEVVGRWKKQGLVFDRGLEKAAYGEVEDDNVLGRGESHEGGNIARLLNDLEEVLWGDALPRSTDLSYDLPGDFDPYAVPSEDALMSPQVGGPPAASNDVFRSAITQHNPFDPPSDHARAVMDEVHAMPDLIPPSPSRSPSSPARSRPAVTTPGDYLAIRGGDPVGGGAHTNQGIAGAWVRQARASFSVQAGGGLPGTGSGEGDMTLTLEEIGRRRHEDWLANQKTSA